MKFVTKGGVIAANDIRKIHEMHGLNDEQLAKLVQAEEFKDDMRYPDELKFDIDDTISVSPDKLEFLDNKFESNKLKMENQKAEEELKKKTDAISSADERLRKENAEIAKVVHDLNAEELKLSFAQLYPQVPPLYRWLNRYPIASSLESKVKHMIETELKKKTDEAELDKKLREYIKLLQPKKSTPKKKSATKKKTSPKKKTTPKKKKPTPKKKSSPKKKKSTLKKKPSAK